jgi:tripartite-type tricarboxylate transporter receptor subunit TctC
MKKILLAALITAATFAHASAQTYPDRPIKLLVPLAAASAVDIAARIVGEKMGDILGQRLFIENQVGAAGALGMRTAARATPDGYTIAVPNDSIITMIPNMKSDAGYDPLNDFVPITQLVGIPLGLIANPSFPAKNVQEMIAIAKAKPDTLTYASGGLASPQHVAMELLTRQAGVKMVHVPYRGITPAVNDIVSGQVPVGFTALSAVFPLLPDNRVKLLATSTAKRTEKFPNVPTVAESGLPGFQFVAWCALLAPAKTPPEIVAKLNAAAVAALKDPAVRNKLVELGLEIGGSTPAELAKLMRDENQRMGNLIREANIRSE